MIRLNENEVILHNNVYNLESFSEIHPGGKQILNIFGGNDVTIHYHMLHNHKTPRFDVLEPYKLRTIEFNKQMFIINSSSFQNLKNRVRKALPYQYASLEWYSKAFFLLGFEMYLEYDNITNGFSLFKSTLLGFIMALIGLNIQHDANHGAVSSKPWINTFWGYTQDWIGGSALLWRHHHVLMHHSHTNVLDFDPDVTTNMMRLHYKSDIRDFHMYQSIYVWFLLPLLPFSWHFKEIYDLVFMNHCGKKICKMAYSEAFIALIFRILFIIRFYIIPMYYYPNFSTLFYISYSLIVGGAYLGFNFIISHNFTGVKPILTKDSESNLDWAKYQVESSSTVGGKWLGFINGGLNYQIEHHLFPKISHVHYPLIQKILRDWCKENNIKYTYFNNIVENFQHCIHHLYQISF